MNSRGGTHSHVRTISQMLEATSDGNVEAAHDERLLEPQHLLEEARARIQQAAESQGFQTGMREAESRIEEAIVEHKKRLTLKHTEETERVAALANRLEEIELQLAQKILSWEQTSEQILIEATFAATSKVCAQAIQDGSALAHICREVLAECPVRPVVLKVAPDNVETVAAIFRTGEIKVEGDADLQVDQCRLESARGMLETGLRDRLEAMKEAFILVISKRRTHS